MYIACCTDFGTWRIVPNPNSPCDAFISINEDNTGCTQDGLFDSFTGYYYYTNGWNSVQSPETPLVSCSNTKMTTKIFSSPLQKGFRANFTY